jgi:hypothetical protein
MAENVICPINMENAIAISRLCYYSESHQKECLYSFIDSIKFSNYPMLNMKRKEIQNISETLLEACSEVLLFVRV